MAKSRAEKIRDAVNKGFKEPIAGIMSEGIASDVNNVVPFGIPVLDKFVIGCGGIPCGRITEIYGNEGAGKTSMSLQAIGQAQKLGFVTILCETEKALMSDRAPVFGVDLSDVITIAPESWGQVKEQSEAVIRAIPKDTPALYVLDSMAATLSEAEVGGLVAAKEQMAARAKEIAEFVRRMGHFCSDREVAVLVINQMRDRPGVMFGPSEYTPGGNAKDFHCSLRLRLWPGKGIKGTKSQHLGKHFLITAMKNKFAPPFRKARVSLSYRRGFQPDWSTLWLAKEWRLIRPRAQKVEDAMAALDACGWEPPGKDAELEEISEEEMGEDSE